MIQHMRREQDMPSDSLWYCLCNLRGIRCHSIRKEREPVDSSSYSVYYISKPELCTKYASKLIEPEIRSAPCYAVNGHLRIPFFGHEKSPRKGRRVYEQELCISSYLLYASLSWCMLRYGYSSFHSHRLRWLMPSPVVQGDGVFGNYHL